VNGFFVVGTDTGVGKTAVARAIAASLPGRVVIFKPVVTGTDEPGPTDTERLAEIAPTVVPHHYGPAVSPHLAAELAGDHLALRDLVGAAQDAAAEADTIVVEGVGGLLVPLNDHDTVRDLARELGLPLVIAARPGLGTINHTLLTLEAARDLQTAAVVLTPWPEDPSLMETSNRETIARMGGVRVDTLGMDALALPVEAW
jgi:dethiobiotin synthetase